MRRFAVHRHDEAINGEIGRIFHVRRLRVHHHRHVGLDKGTGVEETNLAAATFFGRTTKNGYSPARPFGDLSKRQTSPEPGGGDHIVTAPVADCGERVVLQTDHHVRSGLTAFGNE